MQRGSLFLVPASLGESKPDAVLPEEVQRIARSLRYFVVENAKSARAELRRIGITHPIRDIDIRELPREPSQVDLDALLAPLFSGESAGLMSEAGVPAVEGHSGFNSQIVQVEKWTGSGIAPDARWPQRIVF